MATATKSAIKPLTPRETQVWRFMLRFQAKHHGLSPRLAEICEACKIGTVSGAGRHVKNLGRKGKVLHSRCRYIAIAPASKD